MIDFFGGEVFIVDGCIYGKGCWEFFWMICVFVVISMFMIKFVFCIEFMIVFLVVRILVLV